MRGDNRVTLWKGAVSYSTAPRPLPPEIGPAGRRGARVFVLVAKIDAAAREIVRRDLHDHAVADAGADAELAHLARHIRENHVFVVEGDAIVAVGQHLGHRAVEFEQLFFGHYFLLLRFRECPASRAEPDLGSHAQPAGRGVAPARAGHPGLYCRGVSPPDVFLASSISVAATRISARVLRSGASNSACFSAVP